MEDMLKQWIAENGLKPLDAEEEKKLAFSVMTIRRINENLKETYVFCLLSGILSLWMATKYFPWKLLSNEIGIIQFPWRLLMVSSFFLSISSRNCSH